MRDTADQQTRQFELRARGLNFTADQHITDMERMYIHQNLNVFYGTNLNVPGSDFRYYDPRPGQIHGLLRSGCRLNHLYGIVH